MTKIATVEDIEGANFSPLKMVLILPTAMIQSIVSGEIVDFSAFPQTQVNFALTCTAGLALGNCWKGYGRDGRAGSQSQCRSSELRGKTVT